MFKVTQTQRENLLHALNVMWPKIPKKAVPVGLSVWTGYLDKSDCRQGCTASHCFGGWVSVEPYFNERGVGQDSLGAPTMLATWQGLEGDLEPEEVSENLFGVQWMFDWQGKASEKYFHGAEERRTIVVMPGDLAAREPEELEIEPWQVVQNRMEYLLKNSEVVA